MKQIYSDNIVKMYDNICICLDMWDIGTVYIQTLSQVIDPGKHRDHLDRISNICGDNDFSKIITILNMIIQNNELPDISDDLYYVFNTKMFNTYKTDIDGLLKKFL